jgi:hypothetical protein
LEVLEDGSDASVGVRGFGEVEFDEDAADVGFDAALEVQLFADRGIGEAFGHEGEDFDLS